MKQPIKTLCLVFLSTIILSGCSACRRDADTIDWKQEVSTYEQKGWKYKETLGTPGDAVIVINGNSDNARTISGFWVVNGQRHEKEYKQDTQVFCILGFGKSNGDTFTVVLSKDKPGGESK